MWVWLKLKFQVYSLVSVPRQTQKRLNHFLLSSSTGGLWLTCFNKHAICWWEMKAAFIPLWGCCRWMVGTEGQKQKKKIYIIIIFWLEQIFPEIQEVNSLGTHSWMCCWECSLSYTVWTRGQILPFSCSAASLKSGNLDPTMLWLRISLCSFIHIYKNRKVFLSSSFQRIMIWLLMTATSMCSALPLWV